MADNDQNNPLEVIAELNQVFTERNIEDRERLDILSIAWLLTAGNVRAEALAIPEGFPAEQARQITLLDRLALLVREDTPDLEGERLFQEGDYDGMMQHYARRLSDAMREADQDRDH